MKESILGKSLMNVNSVERCFAIKEVLEPMKKSTLGKSLMNVNSVASVLVL